MSLIEEALRRLQEPTRADKSPVSEKVKIDIKNKPTQKKEIKAVSIHKVLHEEASPPKPVHSWSPAPPKLNAPAAPTSGNPLVAVTVASLTLTVALVVGGAFWLGHALGDRQPVSLPSPLLITTSSRPDPQISTHSPQPIIHSTPAYNETAELAFSRSELSIATQIEPFAELVVSGVVVGAGEPFAMINNKIIGIGESIDEITVVEIQQDAILVKNQQGNTKLIRISR